MRTLLYVPTVHTPEESGGGRAEYRMALTGALGTDGVSEMDTAVREFWQETLRRMVTWISRLQINPGHFHVYLDGLADIRDRFGRRGLYLPTAPAPDAMRTKPTNRVVWTLHRSGALVHGTEDPELMHECAHKMDTDGFVWKDKNDPRGPWLMRARDPYIAQTIHETLPDGHWGILFIGAAHRTDEEIRKAAPDIRIIYVAENPATGTPATPLS